MRFPHLYALAAAATLAIAGPASAQLRIVSYNTAEGSPSQLSTVFTAIGEELRNGIAKPIDVLSLQEQSSPSTTTESILNQLNAIYGAGTYARGTRVGQSSGAGQPALIYNTQTVELIAERVASTVSGSGGARQTLRYELRPVGYDDSADFYLYSSHYKSSDNSTDANRRNAEATQVRSNADGLGEGASLIFTGDFNLYDSGEPAYQTLLSSGPGQAHDPLNPNNVTQNWNNNSSFAAFHTQSPCSSSTGNCGVGGGVDSRFDFQLVSGEVIDDEGFSLIDGSYHPFGNNGSTYNQSINSGSNTVTFPGVTSFTKSQVLSALHTATDHLPLVADYQLPAVLDAFAATVPTSLVVGEAFELDVTVLNDADVVAAIGADELDYSLTTSGDLSGAFVDTDLALGGGNVHGVLLDTSTPGMKSGVITVSTSSQSAANSLVTIPVSFEVLAATLAGDYNDDGVVDAADYTVFRDAFASGGTLVNETESPGVVDINDYGAWATNYGATAGPSAAVPEPSTLCLLTLFGASATACKRR